MVKVLRETGITVLCFCFEFCHQTKTTIDTDEGADSGTVFVARCQFFHLLLYLSSSWASSQKQYPSPESALTKTVFQTKQMHPFSLLRRRSVQFSPTSFSQIKCVLDSKVLVENVSDILPEPTLFVPVS